MKKLIDVLLEQSREERARQPFARLRTRKDIVRYMPLLVRLLNRSPELAARFLANPLLFFEDMGIKMESSVRDHILRTLPREMKGDRKKYESVRNGKGGGAVNSAQFSIPESIRKLGFASRKKARRTESMKPEALDFEQRAARFIPLAGAALSASRSAVTLQQFLANTGGWNVAAEIHESFYRELWNLYFRKNFEYAILLAMMGTIESELVEPWHDYYTWFLSYIHLRLIFSLDELPEFSLDTGAADKVKFIYRCRGQLRLRSSPSKPWSEPSEFSIRLEKVSLLERKESGTFAGQTLHNYYSVDLTSGEEVTVEIPAYPDDILLKTIVKAAADDFISKELGPIPLVPPLQESLPFMTFEQSHVNVVDTGEDMDSVAVTYGLAAPLQSTFIRPGRNFSLGISAAVMHFNIRSGFPPLPHWVKDDDGKETPLEITRMEVELVDGYILAYGNGIYHTGSCQPNIRFTYRQIIDLVIDEEGQFKAQRRGNPSINVQFNVILYLLLPVLGGFVDLIVDVIAESLFGKQAGESIDEYLDVSLDVEKLFSASFGPASLEADVAEVEVNRNGVFFHGDLSVSMD